MKEELLQKQLVDWINEEKLLDFINGAERLDEAVKIDSDENIIPNFSIDHLLKQKYSRSAKQVLESLKDYEVITGEIIQNISLDKNERLFPDLILFNRSTCQLIVIENKTGSQTEREAITELLGYAHEIRNHLPFFSNYDINYILISTEFNTLLDHSVSGEILSGDLHLLCLKPVVTGESITGLDIYFPKSWNDIGQSELPENALVGYSLCLYEKEELGIDQFDYQTVIEMAADLIVQDAARYGSHGFHIVWKNGLERNGTCIAGITLYILNSYAFLPRAYELGFALNKKSALSRYLMAFIDENGTGLYPESLFGIAAKAEKLLEGYFDLEWDRASNWVMDTGDLHFALQRNVLLWNSWGAIGDYVRYFYLHPSQWFPESEKTFFRGYRNPFIGLQVVYYLSGNTVFKSGHFSHKEIFLFALQLGRYMYACKNVMEGQEDAWVSAEALLFWTALPLSHSLKEVGFRLNAMPGFSGSITFPLAVYKKNIYPDYDQRIEKYIAWFQKDFIDESINPTMAFLFKQGVDAFHYFDAFMNGATRPEERTDIEHIFGNLVRETVADIAVDRLKNQDQHEEVLNFINDHYFDGSLFRITQEKITTHLAGIANNVLVDGFSEVFLALLDSIKGVLPHQLNKPYIPDSVDWNAFKLSAEKLFDAGQRKTAIIISANSHVILGTVELPMILNGRDEIFVQFNTSHSMQVMTLRKKWTELLDGTFKL
jgi:hypothetical protein